jgi:hypothetical protein
VAALSREQFDSIEFDAAASGDHAAAARQMLELANTGTETAAMPRAEAFLRAGEQWLMADEPAEAVTGLRQAMADGGRVFTDPRIPLARAFFLLDRQSEAQALISRVKTDGPVDARTCDLVAELLVEQSDLAAALEWATAGVELCLGSDAEGQQRDDDESELRLLLRLRYRIRNDLGLAEDAYDAMLDES